MWTFDLDSALKHILNFLSSNINISRSVIYIYNEKNNFLSSELVYINGMILIGDEELYIDHQTKDERIWAILNKKDIITPTYIYLPLDFDGRIYGLISVDKSLDKTAFTLDEINLVKKVAKYIGSGIYQEKIIKDRDNRIKQLNALLQISMLLNSKDSSMILKYVGQALIKYGKFDRVRIFIRQINNMYHCQVTESIISQSVSIEQKDFSYEFFNQKDISDIYYIISLENGDLPLGFIEVDNIISQVKFEEEQINFLKIIAAQLSITLNNISLVDKLKQISVTDPLTGVFNYRYLMEYLKKEVNRAKRTNSMFSVLLIDIDDFKYINDTFGHLAGDEALKILANTMHKISRNIDIISRYGGDEFIIVAPDTNKNNAIKFGNKLLKECPVLTFKHKKEKIKLSIGIATYPEDTQSITKLIKIADSRLYSAKSAGKNQISSQINN